MGRISDAQKTGPRPLAQTIHGDRQKLDVGPILQFLCVARKKGAALAISSRNAGKSLWRIASKPPLEIT